jgi:ABC-type glycerol-3-phosphate transport system permease component
MQQFRRQFLVASGSAGAALAIPATAPMVLIFAFFQRSFVEGLIRSALK